MMLRPPGTQADLAHADRPAVMEAPTFLTILGLRETTSLDPDELASALRDLDRERAYRVALVQLPESAADPCLKVDVDNADFLIVLRPGQPAPTGLSSAVQAAALTWKGAASAVREATAQVIVAAGRPAGDHAAAVKVAYLLTVVTEAVMRVADPVFVYWGTADLLVEPRAFSTAATAMLKDNQPPVLQWVRFDLFRGPGSGASTTGGMRSKGLAPFVGYELELEPVAKPPLEIARRAVGYAEHLVREGPAALAEEIDGPARGERIKIEPGAAAGQPLLRMKIEEPR